MSAPTATRAYRTAAYFCVPASRNHLRTAAVHVRNREISPPGESRPGRRCDPPQASALRRSEDRHPVRRRDRRASRRTQGITNALFLKNLVAKTHRGLRSRVETGRSGRIFCYGQGVVKLHDTAGQPTRGERSVDEAEAEIVRRIFRAFASVSSPHAVARRVYDDGIPDPKGRLRIDFGLHGRAKRGKGLLNSDLLVGRQENRRLQVRGRFRHSALRHRAWQGIGCAWHGHVKPPDP